MSSRKFARSRVSVSRSLWMMKSSSYLSCMPVQIDHTIRRRIPTLYFHRNSRTSSIVTTSNLKLRWRQWPWLVEKVRAPIEDILRLVVALVWIAENCLRTLVTFLQMLEAMMRWPMPSIWHSCSKEEKKSLLKMWALPHSREKQKQLSCSSMEKISLTGTLYRLRTNTDTRQKLVFLKLFVQKIRTVIPSIRLLRL